MLVNVSGCLGKLSKLEGIQEGLFVVNLLEEILSVIPFFLLRGTGVGRTTILGAIVAVYGHLLLRGFCKITLVKVHVGSG